MCQRWFLGMGTEMILHGVVAWTWEEVLVKSQGWAVARLLYDLRALPDLRLLEVELYHQSLHRQLKFSRHIIWYFTRNLITYQHPPGPSRRSKTLIRSKVFSCTKASTAIAPAGPAPMTATRFTRGTDMVTTQCRKQRKCNNRRSGGDDLLSYATSEGGEI